MLLRDLIESPISDLTVHGLDTEVDAPLNAFSQADRRVLRSPKAREKIIQAFTRTPFVFEVHFAGAHGISGDEDEHNNSVDTLAKDHSAGVHDDLIFDDDLIVKGEPGKIKVVVLSNLSPIENNSGKITKMPMSPWTLAHKIGHSLQDEMGPLRSRWGGELAPLLEKINELISRIGGSAKETKLFSPGLGVINHLTMRSARTSMLENPFEVFPELVAQFLITGRVTLKKGNERHAAAINKALTVIFKKLEGKVLVEV